MFYPLVSLQMHTDGEHWQVKEKENSDVYFQDFLKHITLYYTWQISNYTDFELR